MEKNKNDFKSALRLGFTSGLVVGATWVSVITSGIALEDYNFKNWVDEKSKNPILVERITEPELENNAEHVYMLTSKKTLRNRFLYTDSIATCCGLAIDNKKENTHYLGHFARYSNWKEIRDSITNKFSNLEDLEPTIIIGGFHDPKSTRRVYGALKNLNLLDKTKYMQGMSAVIKDGKIYRLGLKK